MKILYITTLGRTMTFFQSLIQELIVQGNEVDIACAACDEVPNYYRDYGCRVFPLSCSRSPLSVGNLTSVKEIKKLVVNEQYDIVHCHTPIAAACTRLACKGIRKERKQSNKPLRVFYTAHGFHFYKGAPKKNWIIFYPIEKLCARWTDTLITINKEDYSLAKNKFEGLGKSRFFDGCKVEYVPGVGVDVEKFANTVVDRKAKRAELGVPEDAFLIASAGELNRNKNHEVVIRALAKLNNPNTYYLIAGQGDLKEYLEGLICSLNLQNNVKLLGYRSDLPEIYKCADLCAFPSIREGLGLAALEGMAAGLPLICADNRGTRDYAISVNNFAMVNAIVMEFDDVKGLAKGIERFVSDNNLYRKCSSNATNQAQYFSSARVLENMKRIYFEQ